MMETQIVAENCDPTCHREAQNQVMPQEKPFYAPDHRIPERQPSPGFKLWELRNGDRVLTCELRDDERAGAGVDVQLLENGELLVFTRCITGESARYVAQSFKNDHLRSGWTEQACTAADA